MKILLLGATGLLGSEFLRILKCEQADFLAPSHQELDILNSAEVQKFFAKYSIDLIIDCVAWTAVDEAEKSREKCHQLNVEGLKTLLQSHTPLIHFSTDYVFAGQPDDILTENFPRNPLNYYGETKLEAEKLLENYDTSWWNIRTSWLFGAGGKNFITTILADSSPKKIVADEVGRPTSAQNLAEFVWTEFIQNNLPSGHYHCQNTGEPVSWANLAKFCYQQKNLPTEITEISAKKLNRPVRRPTNSVLVNTKLKNNLPDWKTAVIEFLTKNSAKF